MAVQVENPLNRLTIDPLKYLNNLPEFCGDSRDLQTFTTLIDRIHPHLQTYDELSQLLFSDVIKSKLKGKARQAIEINCHATSWTEIKTILQNNFGDRRSCEELFDELRSVTFRTNTLDFYNDLKNRLHRLNNKLVVILGETEATRESAMNNKRTALNLFKSKIPESMKSILFCRNPRELEEAMDILFQAGYAYTENSNGNKTQPNVHPNKRGNQQLRNNTQYRNSHHLFPNHGRNFQQPPQNHGRNFQQPPQNHGRNFQQPPQNHGRNFQQSSPDQERYFQQPRSYQQINAHNHVPQNPPFQLNRQNFRKQPEPMDIGKIEIAENFQESASQTNYHL